MKIARKNQYYDYSEVIEIDLILEEYFPRSMMKNRIVVIEKSTNKNRTFVLFFLPSSIYFQKFI